MDPHGADQRGNPLGGLLFSNAFSASGGNANNYVQAIEWHNFMGGGAFCLKACDPSRPNAARYCEHIYDRIGCQYNAPASYASGVFESCLGDSQDFPGKQTYAENRPKPNVSELQVSTLVPTVSSAPILSQMRPSVPSASSTIHQECPLLLNALPVSAQFSTVVQYVLGQSLTCTSLTCPPLQPTATTTSTSSSSSSASTAVVTSRTTTTSRATTATSSSSTGAAMAGAIAGNAGWAVGALGVLAAALF